jgi:CRP/FNR family cyclic AMP-dependent transcriptional regulator
MEGMPIWSGPMQQPIFAELIGYAATSLVLVSSCFSNPLWLRLFALQSNIAFVLFGYFGAVYPVMVLHILLLPINSFHFTRLLMARGRPHAARDQDFVLRSL